MEYGAGLMLFVAVVVSGMLITESLDPNYIHRAKLLSRQEVEDQAPLVDMFEPSAKKCRRIGERAARMSISCIADTQFYETLSNRVHMSSSVIRRNDREVRELAFKISKCSLNYSKYFEKGCQVKATYLKDRIRCRRMHTRQERTICKGYIKRRYHSDDEDERR